MSRKNTLVDIKRTSSLSDGIISSTGSHGRLRFPEKLVDKARRVGDLGTASVDNGASISIGLASAVSLKACLLETRLHNTANGLMSSPYWGQAGLIQAERLTSTPSPPAARPAKRQALVETNPERPAVEVASSLRCSRFAAIPITCVHNVEDDEKEGVNWKHKFSFLTVVSEYAVREVNFEKAGYTPKPEESILLRKGDANQDDITWEYHDVTTAPKIENILSPLTLKRLSFAKVRDDYEFQVGQKVGMAVYRSFEVTAEDVGLSKNNITADELRKIFGQEGLVNVYTGQITKVSPGKEAFEHNINSFRGCSGAVIFLLDVDQKECGVIDKDCGKAIAIHVGGHRLEDGTSVNFAFKIL